MKMKKPFAGKLFDKDRYDHGLDSYVSNVSIPLVHTAIKNHRAYEVNSISLVVSDLLLNTRYGPHNCLG